MKKYKVTVIGVDFTLDRNELERLLIPVAFERVKRVIRQGGEISIGIKSIKPELLEQDGTES
jgi:hypothetical protein